MGKIVQLDTSRKKHKVIRAEKSFTCDHKQVIAYTYYRTVRCSICGMELDPFDVLVDMLKAYVQPEGMDIEEKKILREIEKREGKESFEED